MKKSFLLSSLLVAGSVTMSHATRISPEEAFARINSSAPAKAMSAKVKNSFKFDSTIGNLYLFTSTNGYMILPNNDEAPAVLGYSDDSDFTVDGNPALEEWLNFYNRELSYLNDNSSPSKATARAARPERAPISPLTKTLWNQGAPYNDMCPTYQGQKCVTGCVATAMAQVLKYHNYPEKGLGTNSYVTTKLHLSVSYDFANTNFDWANMTDTYGTASTDAQKTAVANLMFACGVSVNMNYTPQESGASPMSVGQSLINYFNYDNGLWMPARDYYGLYEWEDMIYADLAEGLPVLYGGQGTAGGHQFICDGYSSDGYFHFNWGWGGMSDGYFLLTALNPSSLGIGGGAGGFNTGQMITLGVKPPVEGSKPKYIFYCNGDLTSNQTSVSSGEYFTLTTNASTYPGFWNYSMVSIPAGLKLGMRIVSNDGTYDQYILGGTSDVATSPGGLYSSISVTFPNLPDGTYTITPAFNAGDEWQEIPAAIGDNGKILATVSDHTATLSEAPAITVTVTDIVAPSTIYIGADFPLSFSVVNDNAEEYVGKVIPILLDSNNEMVAQSVYSPVDVLGNSKDDVTGYIGNFSAVQGTTLTAGTYTLVFCDANGYDISEEPIEVTLAEAPSTTTYTISNFKLLNPNPVTDSSEVKFSLDVTCTEGYFAKALTIAIFTPPGGGAVAADRTDILYLNAGESQTTTVSLNLSTLENGSYFAGLFDGSKQLEDAGTVNFELNNLTTGIEDVRADKNRSETVFNLHGQRCEGPLQPGLYIINGKKVVIR